MTFWKTYKPYILQIGLALAVGGVSPLLSGGQEIYDELVRPPLSPPGWVFPVVWTILYILMGIGAGLVQTSGDRSGDKALRAYYIQLALNLLWSPIFFRFELIGLAAVWLVLLTAAVWTARQRFAAVSDSAGTLLLPYFLWGLFALYLNVGFVLLN